MFNIVKNIQRAFPELTSCVLTVRYVYSFIYYTLITGMMRYMFIYKNKLEQQDTKSNANLVGWIVYDTSGDIFRWSTGSCVNYLAAYLTKIYRKDIEGHNVDVIKKMINQVFLISIFICAMNFIAIMSVITACIHFKIMPLPYTHLIYVGFGMLSKVILIFNSVIRNLNEVISIVPSGFVSAFLQIGGPILVYKVLHYYGMAITPSYMSICAVIFAMVGLISNYTFCCIYLKRWHLLCRVKISFEYLKYACQVLPSQIIKYLVSFCYIEMLFQFSGNTYSLEEKLSAILIYKVIKCVFGTMISPFELSLRVNSWRAKSANEITKKGGRTGLLISFLTGIFLSFMLFQGYYKYIFYIKKEMEPILFYLVSAVVVVMLSDRTADAVNVMSGYAKYYTYTAIVTETMDLFLFMLYTKLFNFNLVVGATLTLLTTKIFQYIAHILIAKRFEEEYSILENLKYALLNTIIIFSTAKITFYASSSLGLIM